MLRNEKAIDPEYVRKLLSYDPDTGEFTWRVPRSQNKIGSIAGSKDHFGYVRIAINGVRYRAHRLAFACMTGRWPDHDVDHVNRDKSDNRWANLRCASRSMNCANVHGRGSSGYRGVSRFRNKWKAAIQTGSRYQYLGLFSTPEEAADAYDRAAIQTYGQYAFVNSAEHR